MDKIDGRCLTQEGRRLLREMVVRLRNELGLTVEELSKVTGIHPTTIKGWLARFRAEGAEGLAERRRGRRPGTSRKLTESAETWLWNQIVQGSPRRLGLPCSLWNRSVLHSLIRDRYEIELEGRLLGKYLYRWGFLPRRPIEKAVASHAVLTPGWMEREYPRLRLHAMREGAVVRWADIMPVDESALARFQARNGTEDPPPEVSRSPHALSVVSATSWRGEIEFQVIASRFDTARFIHFLTALTEDIPRKIYLVADHLWLQQAQAAKDWLLAHADRIELVGLPPDPRDPSFGSSSPADRGTTRGDGGERDLRRRDRDSPHATDRSAIPHDVTIRRRATALLELGMGIAESQAWAQRLRALHPRP